MSKMGEEAVGGGRTRRAVMVTALPVEYEAVCEHLTDLQEDEHAQGDVYERGLLAAEGQTWEVGVVEIGAGNPNAAMKTERAIAHFQPEVVVFVGVAGGLKDVQIGDVVVATKVYGYHAGKAEAEFKTRPEVGQPTHRMAERARAEARKEEWLKRLAERGQPIPTPRPHVFLGPIAAGEQVVVSKQSQTYQLIRASYGDALAVEMEGYGFLKATHATSNVEALVVRGISDLVEGKTEADEGGSQPRAARHAAAFAFQVLAKLAPAPSPHSFATDTRQQQGRPVTPSAVKGHSTLPYQPTFFGRRKERQIIAEAIDPDARGWGVLIDGPGGIGKTALAIQAGHDAPAAHFPRKIFLSAKARELTPAGPQPLEDFQLPNYLALLTELAREVGEEQIAQLEPAERPSAVRRALADQRALIVIDNVETLPEAERVRLYQFLSRLPPSCKAIVTSRRRSDIDARVIRLDRLERPDALALMAELAKNNRALARATAQEREDFYEITGGNPLLIQWVAGQLGRPGSQCRTIAAACEYMQSAPPDNDPLEFIFGDLLDTFTPHETTVLAALTHFSQPAQVQWVADLAGLARTAAQTALEDLTARALLVGDEDSQTFLLPSLAAVFLRRQRPEAVTQTGDRLADRAYALAVENGYQKYERFAVLEAEWPTVAAALPRLLQGDNARLQSTCSALFNFLHFSGRWDELLALNQPAEEKASAAGDFDKAGWRAHQAGWVYGLRGQAAETLAWAARCESHWQKARAGAREQAVAAQLRGWGHKLEKNYAAATAAYQEALKLDRALSPESADVAADLNDLAGVEWLTGDYTAAEGHTREALGIAQKVNDREGVATFTGNLAGLALDREDWAAAEALARQALPLAEAVGKQESVAHQCGRLAQALAGQGRREEGRPYARRAVDIFTRLRSPDLAWAQAILQACEGDGA